MLDDSSQFCDGLKVEYLSYTCYTEIIVNNKIKMILERFWAESVLKVKNYFKKIIKIKKSPHAIALGFSVGSFIALIPTLGFAYLIGLGVLFILPRINKFSLFIGIAFWNPLILVPVYRYGYLLGSSILGDLPGCTFSFSFNSDIIKLSSRFLLGNFIIASLLSLLSYFIIYFIIKYIGKQKK